MKRTIDMEEITAIASDLTSLCASIALSVVGAERGDPAEALVNKLAKAVFVQRADQTAEAILILLAVMIKKEVISLDAILALNPEHMRKSIVSIYDEIIRQISIDTPEADLTSFWNIPRS